MLRSVVALLLLTAPAVADVCDRSRYQLTEWKEADQPIVEARIHFTYESGVIVYGDGARETVYCIRNDSSAPIYVKWHGPRPDLLFESYATGRGYGAVRGQKSYTSTSTENRRIEYGLSRNYGKETSGGTITFAQSETFAEPMLVQATPLDLVGLEMPDVLADPEMLERFLTAYQSDENGGNELAIWSYSSNWLPADLDVLARLAAGDEIEDYDGAYIPVSFGLASVINIEAREATSSVQFWFGHFTNDVEAFALAEELGIRDRLRLIAADIEFTSLDGLNETESYVLPVEADRFNQVVYGAKVGGGATAKIVPWTVGVAFDGIAISAVQAEVFAN